MSCRRLKQTETPEGYKQSQITDFFQNSTSLRRRKLFKDTLISPKMSIRKGKFIDSDDDFENPVRERSPLPYSLSSDNGSAVVTNAELNKPSTSKAKHIQTPKNTKDNLHSTQVIMQLNKPSTSKAKHIQTPKNTKDNLHSTQANNSEKVIKSDCTISKIDTPSKMNKNTMVGGQLSKMENISILENVVLTPKKSCSEAFSQKVGCEGCSDGVESPSKKIRVDLPAEEKILEIQINLYGASTVNRTPTNNNLSKKLLIRSKDDTSTPQKKKTKQTPKTSPTRTRKNSLKTSESGEVHNSDNKVKAEEDDKLNMKHMEHLKSLFEETLQDKEKKELLTTEDIHVIEEFLKIDVNHQYFLMKLFLYQPLWYKMQNFCTRIKLAQKLTQKEIATMYEYHKNNIFVHTDLSQLTTDELLNMLQIGDLRQIVGDLKLNGKKLGSKENTIQYLKKNCRTQSTLTKLKSSEDILKNVAYKYLGYCIKLRENVRSSFKKAYVLQTYSNMSYCEDIQSYLKDVCFIKVVYPDYDVENFTPFKTKEQFSRFYEAILIKIELSAASDKKDYVVIKHLCDVVFEKLKFIDDTGKWKRHLQDYLRKFSAEYQYITILNRGIKKLNKYPDDVKIWLEFLIANYPSNSAIGFWFKQLAHITLNSLKKYETAAEIVINAFEFDKKEKKFDFLQIYELTKLSNKIRTTKTYKVCALYCEKLIELSELPIETNIFQKKFITSGTDRSGSHGKRIYFYEDANNEVTYGSVESIALKSYFDDDNYEGVHCEGKLIIILFNLLFWDIIYEYYVPRTFISKLQNAPLDMYSSSFYEHRKKEIDLRLEEIASGWSEEKLVTVLKDNWKNHSHKKSVADFEGLGKTLEEILIMFHCIDRKVLSKIFGRLVTNYRKFRSGLPDLFLWKKEISKCKFVEVKGEGDTLQPNQILWMKHLLDIGADVEVCHVSGVGSKKNLMKEFENTKSQEDISETNE